MNDGVLVTTHYTIRFFKMKKYNYMVTASFINDKTRRVHTADKKWAHFSVGKFDMMHDSEEGAVYVKTPKLGVLMSFVSLRAIKHHQDAGTLNEAAIIAWLESSMDKAWPEKASAAREWLLSCA